MIPREGLFRKRLAKQACDWGDARRRPNAEFEAEIAASDGVGSGGIRSRSVIVSLSGEDALHMAYELGREAVELELNVLEIARLHHDVLGAALRKSLADDHERITHAAADFFAESLSAFEMVRRGYKEARERAELEGHHAAIVRRLSALLADTSLALDAAGTLSETLQLVVEAACELTRARCCVATVDDFLRRPLRAVSGVDCDDDGALVARLTALSGKHMGSLRVLGKEGGDFTEFDEAILEQLAQMAAAAVERTRLYQPSA